MKVLAKETHISAKWNTGIYVHVMLFYVIYTKYIYIIPSISVSRSVSTNGLKKVEKKGFSSPNQRPANKRYLFFLLKNTMENMLKQKLKLT